MGDRVTIGTLEELQRNGCLTGKVGSHPVCVFWSDGAAYAVDDRCPHMGFPLHRGSVESGLLTCHWHNARFETRARVARWIRGPTTCAPTRCTSKPVG